MQECKKKISSNCYFNLNLRGFFNILNMRNVLSGTAVKSLVDLFCNDLCWTRGFPKFTALKHPFTQQDHPVWMA